VRRLELLIICVASVGQMKDADNIQSDNLKETDDENSCQLLTP